jgi:hypothetical protein
MASALSSSDANLKGKGQGKDQSPQNPKRGRGRPRKTRQPVVSVPVPDITMEDAAPAIGPRPLHEVDTVGSMPEVPGGPEAKKNDSAGQKPAASAERPRKMTQAAIMKATTGATNAVEVQRQNETAISGAGSVTVVKWDHITWRGVLMGPWRSSWPGSTAV